MYSATIEIDMTTMGWTTAQLEQGCRFIVYAVANVAGVQSCVSRIYTVSSSATLPSVKTPVSATCKSSNALTFEIVDPYRYVDASDVLTITGPGGFVFTNEKPTAEIIADNYSVPVTLPSGRYGTYCWDLRTRLVGEDMTSAKPGAQGYISYQASTASCDEYGTGTAFPVQCVGDFPSYPTQTSPNWKIAKAETKLSIQATTFNDNVRTTIGTKVYVVVRKNHAYHMSFGDGTQYDYSRSDIDGKKFETRHAYGTAGTYAYRYWVTWVEDYYYLTGQINSSISGVAGTKDLQRYTVNVGDIRVLAGSALQSVLKPSIQEAVTYCDAQGGGKIYVSNSLSNSEDHSIDLSVLNNSVVLWVLSTSGYIINGSPVSAYYNGDMLRTKMTLWGRDWYSAGLNPRLFKRTVNVSGSLTPWFNKIRAGDDLNTYNATVSDASPRELASGKRVNIGDGTTISAVGNVTVRVNPAIR